MNFKITLTPDDKGGWYANVPALRIHAGGATRQEARQMAIDAIKFTVESLEDEYLEGRSAEQIETVSV